MDNEGFSAVAAGAETVDGHTVKLGGWGRSPVHDTRLYSPENEADIRVCLQRGKIIARGGGRSYGDSAVSRDITVDMRRFNRYIAFAPDSGQLVAEAGVTLADIIATFLPRGWFPSVISGTKFVTLGGAIAADVQGKNHHVEGSFGRYVDWLDLMQGDGSVIRCSRSENADLFEWTVGGMGLTGVMLRAAVRLRRVETAWIKQSVYTAAGLEETLNCLDENNDSATYSVAWIDCLARGSRRGRSVLFLGNHAQPEDLPAARRQNPLHLPPKRSLTLRFNLPDFVLNRYTMQIFNAVYYRNNSALSRTAAHLVDCDSFFCPLDGLLQWNKLYGRRGFIQYQSVLPLASASAGLQEQLAALARARHGSYLAVLKRLGAQDNHFSFPMTGYTLALDFPANDKTQALLNELDAITLAHGGRFYLAKDSRLTANTLSAADERVKQFQAMRQKSGACNHFMSMQAERLNL